MGALGPWGAALGASTANLHPRIRAYVAAIPPGFVGRGVGVFETVGTPRRWLWPVLALLARDAVLFPIWARDVPFTIENRDDGTTLSARRTLRLPGGERVMVDAVARVDGHLIDRLGRHGRVRVALTVSAAGGALVLESGATWFGGIRVPRAIAPRVHLVEGWDDGAQRQRVRLTLDSPLLGRLYEYSGSFTYAIGPDA